MPLAFASFPTTMLIPLCAALGIAFAGVPVPCSDTLRAGPPSDSIRVITVNDVPLMPPLDRADAMPASDTSLPPDSVGSGPRLTVQRIGVWRSAPAWTDVTADTGRRKSVEYSDWYGRRVTIHRWLSFAMLPLFATSYFSGDQILRADRRSDAPQWARSIHPVAAWSTAGLFGANTVTGVWNLWEGRRDPEGRTKRWLHAGAFLVANAGFVYAGSLGDDARENGDIRKRHRTVALSSMGLSTASWLVMLIANR